MSDASESMTEEYENPQHFVVESDDKFIEEIGQIAKGKENELLEF